MRKHGRRASLWSRFFDPSRRVGVVEGRRRTLVAFASGRQTCLWRSAGADQIVIKH